MVKKGQSYALEQQRESRAIMQQAAPLNGSFLSRAKDERICDCLRSDLA